MSSTGPETENKIKIPGGFLLGASTAAHQVEGNNKDNDWWAAEKTGKVPPSGLACDHYNRYEEDFRIAKGLGLSAFRISIEWARIEPAENQWSQEAVEHYRQVLKKMKEIGLVRMVTLHHFTLPQWLAEKGGFETQVGVSAFARYAWFVAQNLGQEIDLWGTINEPEVYTSQGYAIGKWPPFRKSRLFQAVKVYRNLAKAHNAAYNCIKQVLPQASVGIVKNNVYYEPAGSWLDKVACGVADYFGNRWFLDRVRHHTDFIGLNYYFTRVLKFNGISVRTVNNDQLPKSDMGWQTFPKGIYMVLKGLMRYKKPVYITENGIANASDDMRKDYIRQHLAWALKAREEGLDLRGYFYWSLIDNYEWADGYGPRFGLVEINYETQERRIRPSADIFKELLNA